MRKLWVIAVLFALGVATSANAQTEEGTTPKAEWFGNYSFARVGSGGGFDSGNYNWGWNTALVGNVNRWLGVVTDFSGHYGHQPLLSSLGGGTVGSDLHTFMIGPRITSRRSDRYTPFVHALFGAARVHRDVPMLVGTPLVSSFTSTTQSVSDTAWPFAMKVGGGVDLKVGNGLYYRPIEANYLLTRPNENSIHNLELSTGFSVRFGNK